MSAISRTFGGLRTGDLHALRWERDFEIGEGRFETAWAPRQKTQDPQRLEVPEPLRPIINAWWTLQDEPREGLVFPALRDGKYAKAGKDAKHGVSHAAALRRDLRRAFGIEFWDGEHARWKKDVRPMTTREREVLELGGVVVGLRVLDLILAEHLAEREQEEHTREMHADALVGATTERDPHEVVPLVLGDLVGETVGVEHLRVSPPVR